MRACFLIAVLDWTFTGHAPTFQWADVKPTNLSTNAELLRYRLVLDERQPDLCTTQGGQPDVTVPNNLVIVTKIDSQGQFNWLREIPSGNTQGDATVGEGTFLSVRNDAVVFVVGKTRQRLNWGNGMITQSCGYQNVVVLNYSADGEIRWGKTTGSDKVAPSMFALHQNCPNPFLSEHKNRIQDSVSGFTSLKVYDVLGREVRTLVNENLQAGSYEKTFGANGLASGVYLYRLQAGEFTQTRQLLLLR